MAGSDGFEDYYERVLERAKSPVFLALPEGSRTVAHPHGPNEYGFYRMGGRSSLMPFIAGIYALACQVEPDITPEAFWLAALTSGDPITIVGDKKTYSGKRVNPARLFEALR